MFRSCAVLRAPGGVSVRHGFSGSVGKFNPSAQWTFWSPVWGGNHNALYEDPYFTRREMAAHQRKFKPDEVDFLGDAVTRGRHYKHQLIQGQTSRDVTWSGRKTQTSAIEVSSDIVTCFGNDGSINSYFTPRKNQALAQTESSVHPMSWIYVHPVKPSYCKYCGVQFKRKKNFAKKFDANLLPTAGYQPEGGCVDPCLVYGNETICTPHRCSPQPFASQHTHPHRGKKNGEGVEGAVKL